MQSLCTLRRPCRQWPRNTHYQAGATPYLGRTPTGWIAPACGWRTHSITSSARASSVGGISRPSDAAVLRLMTSVSLVVCWTARRESPPCAIGLKPIPVQNSRLKSSDCSSLSRQQGRLLPPWQRRTNVWRKVTNPARGAKRLRNEFAHEAVSAALCVLPEDDFTKP
jgi:hypothetical protein